LYYLLIACYLYQKVNKKKLVNIYPSSLAALQDCRQVRSRLK
jgi:hypothetical protein